MEFFDELIRKIDVFTAEGINEIICYLTGQEEIPENRSLRFYVGEIKDYFIESLKKSNETKDIFLEYIFNKLSDEIQKNISNSTLKSDNCGFVNEINEKIIKDLNFCTNIIDKVFPGRIFSQKILDLISKKDRKEQDNQRLNKLLLVECYPDYFIMGPSNIDQNTEKLLNGFLNGLNTNDRVTYPQFNEILLVLNKKRISEGFFKFIFKSSTLRWGKIKNGVIFFRGIAMLYFGSFRFAYSLLSQKSIEELKGYKPQWPIISDNRSTKMIDIEPIDSELTWLGGYLSKKILDKDKITLTNIKNDKKFSEPELAEINEILRKISDNQNNVKETGALNTRKYLAWDEMNVYVATSMRHKHEFIDITEFTNELFSKLKDLNLRYFDPTLSFCESRIDKGISEALMLKRASCTIYMVQESDTLGKDSELASTLAQGKPVIAYIPEVKNLNDRIEKIKNFPLDFFKHRVLQIDLENIFDDYANEFKKIDSNYAKLLDEFIELIAKHRIDQPFVLWEKKDKEFKNKNKDILEKIAEILSLADQKSFNKRADTLIRSHPLALQVHLESGVVNGILVVRNTDDCAKLLRNILMGQMKFTIETIKNEPIWGLIEDISKCPFRVVTKCKELTNSFWNFYFLLEDKK